MSIDIDLRINTGKRFASVCDVGNMTNNVQPMWRHALREGAGVEMSLCDFHEMPALTAIPLLEKALEHMLQNPSIYKPMNPPNGWGSYETAVEYLSDFLDACKDHPACVIFTDC